MTRGSQRLNRLTGTLVVLLVAAGYAWSLFDTGIPPGHPYAGMAFTCVGLAQMIDTREHSPTRIFIYGCALAATLPWLMDILKL